ncbi:MAG: DUF6183 family protein [Actinomycetota bacterium]
MEQHLRELVEAGDLNGLLRAVDVLCGHRDWENLLDLAEACEDAVERGKQLWPITAHIDYRIALEAPGEYAADVLESDLGRFALGPLTEVAASTHSWAELVPHIEASQTAAYVAQERVLRGEVIDDERAHPDVLHLPLRLEDWEPTYALATYRSNVVEVSEPWDPREPMGAVEARPADVLDEPELVDGLLELVQPWVAESNGAARAVVVEGDAIGAASNLTFGTLGVGALGVEEALQRLAWAAASGGAHGRRRGAAFGRFMAWYTVCLLGDIRWPGTPDQVRDRARQLRWYRWDEGEVEEGWVLRIAVEEPTDGWSVALVATDLLEDEEEA